MEVNIKLKVLMDIQTQYMGMCFKNCDVLSQCELFLGTLVCVVPREPVQPLLGTEASSRS